LFFLIFQPFAELARHLLYLISRRRAQGQRALRYFVACNRKWTYMANVTLSSSPPKGERETLLAAAFAGGA